RVVDLHAGRRGPLLALFRRAVVLAGVLQQLVDPLLLGLAVAAAVVLAADEGHQPPLAAQRSWTASSPRVMPSRRAGADAHACRNSCIPLRFRPARSYVPAPMQIRRASSVRECVG